MVAKDLAIKAVQQREGIAPRLRKAYVAPEYNGVDQTHHQGAPKLAKAAPPSVAREEVEANLIVEILDRDFDENCGNRIERMQATIYNRRFYLTAAPFGRGVNELVGIAQWKHGIRKHRLRTHCWSPRTPVL
jgi:hypothetical protein